MPDPGIEPQFSARPKWAEAIREFVTDTVIDAEYGWPDDNSADWQLDLIETAMLAVMCNLYGHEIVDDQCMIPEHRFCVYCNRRASDVE